MFVFFFWKVIFWFLSSNYHVFPMSFCQISIFNRLVFSTYDGWVPGPRTQCFQCCLVCAFPGLSLYFCTT